MTTVTDRIEKEVVLRASRARVWKALTDQQEFGSWFGVRLGAGAFTPGARVRGRITHPGYDHLEFDVTIETVERERRLSWRWHPGAVDTTIDYASEPTTLVTFELEEVPGGTRLTIVEEGFDRIPPARRDEAFRLNEGGWTAQAEFIRKHVEAAP